MSSIAKKQGKEKRGGCNLEGKSCWVGVDVHKVSYAVAIRDEEGQELSFSTPAIPNKLLLQLLAMGINITALTYESGPTGYGLAWACQDAGVNVLVVAPSRVPRPISKTGKTDRLDSEKLAEFLARDMLTSIAIPTRDEFALRELERMRQLWVKKRREVRQHIHAFLLRNGLAEPHGLDYWSTAAYQALQKMDLPPWLRQVLDFYLEEHAHVLACLAKVTKQLEMATIALGHGEQINNLRTIPGVGATIAHTFTAEIFSPERFKKAEQICAFVGLAPITSHSGSGKEKAWTRPVGQRYLRSILVQAAWKLISSDGYYREYYNRIRNKTGVFQKAITAVARKLLVLIWRIAIERRPYRPVEAQ